MEAGVAVVQMGGCGGASSKVLSTMVDE